jgi:hypothetical protein
MRTLPVRRAGVTNRDRRQTLTSYDLTGHTGDRGFGKSIRTLSDRYLRTVSKASAGLVPVREQLGCVRDQADGDGG